MNARISREFSLQAGIHYEGKFIINPYIFELFLDVTTEDIREQNVALDRMKYFLEECLDSCVFVDMQDLAAIDGYTKAGIKVCTVPDGPYDQIIASVLLSKFNAITEKKVYVEEIKINSRICDDLNFFVEFDEEQPLHGLSGSWWRENNTSISDLPKKANKEKIVALKKEIKDWEDIGLTWKPKKQTKNNKVVFIDPPEQHNPS